MSNVVVGYDKGDEKNAKVVIERHGDGTMTVHASFLSDPGEETVIYHDSNNWRQAIVSKSPALN